MDKLEFGPIFRPTMEEFRHFDQYIKFVAKECDTGICKIIPPAEWTRPDWGKVDKEMKIKTPIRQYASGGKGIFQLLLVEEKPISITRFEKMAEKEVMHVKPKKDKKDKDEEVDIERIFWTNLTFSPPLYGADTQGTAFTDDTTEWNLSKLPSLLQLVASDLPGVTSPYMYFGMWKSMFAWHIEDMDLWSINYHHCGKPKHWYAVPPKFASRLEALGQRFFPQEFKKCSEFLRHKTTLINPSILLSNSIPVYKIVQEPGEFVITFPRAYHCGFNYGFNCAEAVNFATEDWLEVGKEAKNCKCVSDTVHINMFDLSRKYELMKEGKSDSEISAIIKTEKAQILEQLKIEEEKSALLGKMEVQEELPSDIHAVQPEEEKPLAPQTPQKTPGKRGRPRKNPLPVEQAELEDEEPKSSSSKKRLSKFDVNVLEDYFKANNYIIPTKEQKQELADKIQWTTKGIHQWFLRRAKTKPIVDDQASSVSISQKQALPLDTSPKKMKTKISQS